MWLDDLLGRTHDYLLTHPDAARARAYLESRGVNEDVWRSHGMGWSAPALDIGTCSKEFADWFPKYWFSRLVFPIRNALGAPIGLVTRPLPNPDMEQKRTYQQFYLYADDRYPYLYGLDQAIAEIWRTRQVVIVEGVFDYLAIRTVTPNAVAILTAGVPNAARRFFRRYVKRVWAVLDMDAAGRFGCYRLAGLIPPAEVCPEGWKPGPPTAPVGYQVRIVSYDGVKDPGQAAQFGEVSEIFGEKLAGAGTIFQP